jgi:inorganic pyrophosphatase
LSGKRGSVDDYSCPGHRPDDHDRHGEKDHKIIAIATEDPEFNAYREASEMPPHRLIMLRRFFQDYKQLEGKEVEVDEIRPAGEAYPIINDALSHYSEQRRKGFIK